MFRTYPYSLAVRNERRSSNRGFFATLLRLLGRGRTV